MDTPKRTIIVYGGGWIHNMGNAFIHLGSKAALERAVPGAAAHIIDANLIDPPIRVPLRYLQKAGSIFRLPFLRRPQEARQKAANKVQVKLVALARPDAVVLSGVWLTVKYLKTHLSYFLALRERGIPIIINGGGGNLYDEEEVAGVSRLLGEIRPFALIARDHAAFEAYRGTVERSYAGIDAGFFVNDAFPRPLPLQRKTVYCFDRGPVPASLPMDGNVLLTHHVRKGLHFNPLRHPTFFSELAEDYLNLYANADTVYSDRVHACVAALAYGNKARLMDKTPRARLFDMMETGEVRETPVSLPRDVLERKKQEHVAALASVFDDLHKAGGGEN